jgi:serine/threonine protein kinase
VDSGAAGRVLGDRYEIRELLGTGGMGDVYAGRDRRLDRDVAVKVMRPAIAESEPVRQRFDLEARLAARLIHPNVVAVFDSGEYDGAPFLVMERLPGRTLAEAIAEGPLDEQDAHVLATEVLAALAAAHASGMVHRDVKPGNILATTTGHWKVADFGIAKSVAAEDSSTVTGLVYGTLAYLAPERVAGGPATVATDLYATGVVLYEALSGRRPVPAGAPPSEYLAPRPAPLTALRPGLPPRLTAAIERAMAIDPAARFPTAEAMANSISGTADTIPIASASSPPTVPLEPRLYDLPARRRRSRARIFGALAVGIAGVGLVIILLMGRGHPTAVPPRPPGVTAPLPAATSPAATGPSATSPSATLPGPLDSAVQRLEQVVRP